MTLEHYTDKNTDGGWAWIVLIVCFLLVFLLGVIQHSTGIIVAAILDEMQTNLSSASWIGSINISTSLVAGPICGIITKRMGVRYTGIIAGFVMLFGCSMASLSKSIWSLIVTYGLITGFGLGMVYVVSFVAIGEYFHRLRAVASGLTASGIALGMFIGPLIIHSIIEKYSVHGMFLIMGAVLFNVTALAMLMRPSSFSMRIETSKETESKEHVTVANTCNDILHIMRNAGFMCYFFSMYTWSAAESVMMIFLPMYAEEQGSTKIQAAALFTGYGICSLISRLVIGLMAGHIKNSLLQASLLGLTGMLHLSFPFYSSDWTNQMIYSAAIGLYTGGATTLLSPLTVEFLELKYLPQGFGILAMASGLAYLTVPVISSEIVVRTGCLSYVFYLGGCLVLLGCIAALIGGVFIERKSTDNPTVYEVELNDKVNHIEHLELEDLIYKKGKESETVLTGLIRN